MGRWGRLRHRLFDNPISQPELSALLRLLLRVALAETDTEAGFERLLRRMVQRDTGLGTEHAWRFVRMHLEPYRRGFEDAAPRVLASRFLADPPLALAQDPPAPANPARRPRLMRLALIYVLALMALCTVGRVCLDRAFPDWSWTDPRPLGLPNAP